MACHCIKNRQGALRVTTFEHSNRQGARRVASTAPSACGWLRGTSSTSPGPPRRWRRPVRVRSTPARGRGFAAYLSAYGGQPFIVRFAHYSRGASLTTSGFVTTGPRYLPPASNSLPFVRGADRTCCAPRKWLYCLICAPLKWSCRPTDALLVLAARTPSGGALACAPGGGTLPPFAALAALVVRRINGIAALFVRRLSGHAARQMLCLYWLPARPPEGHWRAHPAAAPCRTRLLCAA